MKNRFSEHIDTSVLLIGIMLLAFWIRIQGVSLLPDGHFTETDAYLYYWQSQIISEEGRLPERDMYRWLPAGRDNEQLLSLYAYAIAYTHKAIAKIFPNLTLYHIQTYAPAVCFTFGIGGIFLFFTRLYGALFASIIGVLLATLPGSIERSAAGFGDRDAWCWMLGTLAVISYLWKADIKSGVRRYLATALSGFIVFLGGLSWEGFGFFLLTIIAAELWKFCTTDKEHNLKEHLIWMLMFLPGLYLISSAYQNGYGFSTHIAALMLLPPLVVFALRGLRHLLLKYVEYLSIHAQKLAWVLTFSGIMVGIGYFFLQTNTFERTAFAFHESRFMRDIGELMDPRFEYWKIRYGAIFILGSIGAILTCINLWKRKGMPLAISLTLFIGTTFFRDQVSRLSSDNICNIFFFISLGLTLLSLGSLAYLRKETEKNEYLNVAMFTWFLLWVALSREGKRYDFFIGVPLAFFTATFIQFMTNIIIRKVKQTAQYNLLKTSVASGILAAFMFFPPLGAHVKYSIFAATQMRNAPDPNRIKALDWIKTELPQTSVVAANWSYGCQLNVHGGVKTITDADHYIPHWIHLYNQHVHSASTERETLEFLKTHGATHIMLTRKDPTTTPLLREQHRDVLGPVYPTENFEKAPIRVWEINYPSGIQPNPKYLATQPGGSYGK